MSSMPPVAPPLRAEPARLDDVIVLTHDVLTVEQACADVAHPSTGATATFVGTTRNNFGGRPVDRLEYEAYAPMAVREIGRVCAVARLKWPGLVGVAVYHRLGVVPVGESSIVIAASSPHRREALEAVAYTIDTVKATVPIWKKEFYGDGTSTFGHHGGGEADGAWKANKEFDPSAVTDALEALGGAGKATASERG
jgi:molybdopterin synthase catalytic subunit